MSCRCLLQTNRAENFNTVLLINFENLILILEGLTHRAMKNRHGKTKTMATTEVPPVSVNTNPTPAYEYRHTRARAYHMRGCLRHLTGHHTQLTAVECNTWHGERGE